MRALVVGAAVVEGSGQLASALAVECDLIIAADAAGEWCLSIGLTPDMVVGDFDSSTEGAAERFRAAGIEVRVFPIAKDVSDLDLAVAAARSAAATEVVFTGCLAGRLDHTLAALGTVAGSADLHGEAHEPSMDVWAVGDTGGRRTLDLLAGSTVSVFAAGPVEGVSLTGFEYPLTDASMDVFSSLGLSNRILGPGASVSVREGTVLVIHHHDVG